MIYIYMLCYLHGEAKNNKKRFSKWLLRVSRLQHSGKRVSSPSAWAAALGEEGFFPLGEENKKIIRRKRRRLATNDINSSPSARTTLGKAFPECMIFGSRKIRLSREEIPRRLFSECCTWGRLPQVQLDLPRVHLALGEATPCRSATWLVYKSKAPPSIYPQS